MYVSLEGAGAVRRVDLKTQTADLQFPLGRDESGIFYAEDLATIPGQPLDVVVTRRTSSPVGLAEYSDGVKLPKDPDAALTHKFQKPIGARFFRRNEKKIFAKMC